MEEVGVHCIIFVCHFYIILLLTTNKFFVVDVYVCSTQHRSAVFMFFSTLLQMKFEFNIIILKLYYNLNRTVLKKII